VKLTDLLLPDVHTSEQGSGLQSRSTIGSRPVLKRTAPTTFSILKGLAIISERREIMRGKGRLPQPRPGERAVESDKEFK
jgi:hypothetical protein